MKRWENSSLLRICPSYWHHRVPYPWPSGAFHLNTPHSNASDSKGKACLNEYILPQTHIQTLMLLLIQFPPLTLFFPHIRSQPHPPSQLSSDAIPVPWSLPYSVPVETLISIALYPVPLVLIPFTLYYRILWTCLWSLHVRGLGPQWWVYGCTDRKAFFTMPLILLQEQWHSFFFLYIPPIYGCFSQMAIN